jgi:hypothetical protein
VTEFTAGSPSTPHLDPGEVARFAAGTSGPVERERVEAHLAACDSCTEEVVAAWRFGGRRRSRRGWIAALAAAAALFAGVLLWAPRRSAPEGGTVRGREEHGVSQALVIISPHERELVGPGIKLTWRSRQGVATYKLAVADANGDSVWAATTADTAVELPATLSLVRGASYFWYVDALLSEGRSVTSGIHEFRVSP